MLFQIFSCVFWEFTSICSLLAFPAPSLLPAQSPAFSTKSVLVGSVTFHLLWIDTTLEEMNSQHSKALRKMGTQASSMGVQNHLHMTMGPVYERTHAIKPAFRVVCWPSSDILLDLFMGPNRSCLSSKHVSYHIHFCITFWYILLKKLMSLWTPKEMW